jgi:S-adenosylmethionine:tRNA ribosyltransferase-isomerase
MARPSRKVRAGAHLAVPGSPIVAIPLSSAGDGRWVVRFQGADDLEPALRRHASLALPPYIRAGPTSDDRYQTVYADQEGSIAAPTAGLHFTERLLDELAACGVERAFVTLHVGPGTFKPVTAESVGEHHMEAEWGEVPASVANRINGARAAGGRIVAVGTTTTRLLESAVDEGRVRPFSGETDRFIYPGYRFRAIDALITNFHLPRSTLLMLVSALAGRELVLEAYREAVRRGYRFYSFGDAMLIL